MPIYTGSYQYAVSTYRNVWIPVIRIYVIYVMLFMSHNQHQKTWYFEIYEASQVKSMKQAYSNLWSEPSQSCV